MKTAPDAQIFLLRGPMSRSVLAPALVNKKVAPIPHSTESPYAWADIGPKFDPLAICLLLMSSLTSGSAPLAYSYGYNFAPKAKSPSIPSS